MNIEKSLIVSTQEYWPQILLLLSIIGNTYQYYRNKKLKSKEIKSTLFQENEFKNGIMLINSINTFINNITELPHWSILKNEIPAKQLDELITKPKNNIERQLEIAQNTTVYKDKEVLSILNSELRKINNLISKLHFTHYDIRKKHKDIPTIDNFINERDTILLNIKNNRDHLQTILNKQYNIL